MLGVTVSELLYRALSEATTETLHNRRMGLVRREACAAAAQKLKLDQLLMVGRGYEGQVPTQHMLAGEACLQPAACNEGNETAACHTCPPLWHMPAAPLLLPAVEAFEAVWGAICADDGYRMQRVREIYSSLYPLATAPGS